MEFENGEILGYSLDRIYIWIEANENQESNLISFRPFFLIISDVSQLRNRMFAVGLANGTINIYKITNKEIHAVLQEHRNEITELLELSKSGKILSYSSNEGKANIWDVSERLCLRSLTGLSESLEKMFELQDGKIACCSKGSIIIFSESFEMLRELKSDMYSLTPIIQLKDGSLASCSGNNGILVWNVSSGDCIKELNEHSNMVSEIIELNEDGKLASCSVDGSIRILNILSGKCLKILDGHNSCVQQIIELKDGSIVSRSYGIVKILALSV